MSSNQHRKQAKQLKRRVREKEVRKARNVSHNISLRDYVLQLSRGHWCDCYETRDTGMSSLLCIRTTYNGHGASLFQLDEYCLGIKDADILRDVQLPTMEAYAKDHGGKLISPAYALKKITALIAWAQQIGFEPHSKTYVAMEIFRGIDPNDCDEEFAFGRPDDGQPMYISSPYDSPDRIRSVLSKLERLGTNNHSFAVGIDDSLRRSLMLDIAESRSTASDEEQFDEDNVSEEFHSFEAPKRLD